MLAQAYAVLLTACHTMRVRPYTPSAMLLQKLHGRLQPPEKILGRRERARLITPPPACPPPPPPRRHRLRSHAQPPSREREEGEWETNQHD